MQVAGRQSGHVQDHSDWPGIDGGGLLALGTRSATAGAAGVPA